MEDQKNTTPESNLQAHGNIEQNNTDEHDKTDIENSDKTVAVFPPAIQEFVQEVVDDLPQAARTKVTELIKKVTISTMYARGGAPVDPEFLKQQDQHQYQIALKGIEASQVDRREERDSSLVKFKITAGIVAGVILLLVIFSGIAMYNNRTDFILELIKVVGYIVGGLGGGAILLRQKN